MWFVFFGGGEILGGPGLESSGYTARALILRIGFGGIVYCSHHQESPTPYSTY